MAHSEAGLRLKNRPAAGILTLGTELTKGTVVNTNAAYLGKELTSLGFEVKGQTACPDDFKAIEEALGLALARSEVLIVTGGLGPTPDDLTREALADYFGVPLRFSPQQYRLIQRVYAKRKKKVPSLVRREAEFPANATPVLNQFGIALGFTIEEKGKIIAVLPGVPGELTRLFEYRIKPYLKKRFPNLEPPFSLVARTVGLSEPSIMQQLGQSFFNLGAFQFGIYPHVGEVSLRLYADSSAVIRRLQSHIQKKLGKYLYSFSEDRIEAVIGKELTRRRWTLSIAESCTGGKVSEAVTEIPGASRYFRGSVVSYHDQVKSELLGVSRDLLRQKGAVSSQTALAMADGVRRRFGTTLGLSITGIAGPSGGTPQKPVGLIYMALATAKKKKVWAENFSGDRNQIQSRSAKKLLEHLWQWLR